MLDFQAILKIVIMLLVNWKYAVTSLVAVFLIWLYIGTANPAVKPGLATDFKFLQWIRTVLLWCIG